MEPLAESIRRAATEFVGALSAEQRRRASYAFADEERLRWQYTPGPRGGLPLAEISPGQQEAALRLLRAGLSGEAYAAARAVMALETVLREMERRAGEPGWERRDPEHYWFAVFGDPADSTWAWRVGGHHLCVHVTVVGEALSFLPLFLGANPATVPDGEHAGLRVLGVEEDLARGFVAGLTDRQRPLAVLGPVAPPDILTGNEARAEVTAVPSGIGFDALDEPQRRVLTDLVLLYTRRTAEPVAVDPERIRFAWLGSTVPGEGHYYALRADPFFVEYDNTQNDANHVHTVVRNTRRDWGEDLLAAHYAADHGR